MRSDIDIDRFVKDPSLLIELCREVIDRIDSGSDDPKTPEKEAQLREIAKAIERLKKMGVPVPESLRSEKTRIAAALGIHGTSKEALSQLKDGLEDILKGIRSNLGRQNSGKTVRNRRARTTRSSLAKTPQKEYREYIILALKNLGDRARVAEVLEEMSRLLNNKLQSGDFELRKDGKTIGWHNTAQWERLLMVKEGILRSDSKHGYWELSEEYR